VRYTREQLIALRKSSSILPSMKAMTEICSVESQEPVCFTKLEPEDVIRIWNAATNKDAAGRGRGRVRVNNRGTSYVALSFFYFSIL
jgi:pyrimidine deaminase RibD-like protein